jgi:glycosyltransferase involved in cell wall biosynthesis
MPFLAREQHSRLPYSRETPREEVVVLDARVVSGSGGGPDKTILNSPRFLTSAGYRNLCAYLHPENDPGFEQLRKRAQAAEAPLLSIPDRGPWDWRVIGRMLDICRRERVAIWHGHDYKSNALGLLLRRFWPMRLVTTVHGWVKHTRRTPLYYRIDRFCLPLYERVICVSKDLYEECLALKVPAERCLLIENGIDLADYSRTLTREEARRPLGISPERLVVGAIGRLSAEKGFDRLIRAVDRLIRVGLDVELLIAGEGDEEPRLRALAAELGCSERVCLLGYQANVKELYQAFDVFALSSLREGLPNVLLEAMALEVPVLATSIAGVPRLIDDEKSGLLIQPDSVDELTSALDRLLRDAELRRRLARAGRETIVSRFSFAERMRKIQALYDDLRGRWESPPSPHC